MWSLAATDINRFLFYFGWTYDPRLKTPYLPFYPFKRQREYLNWLVEREEKGERGIAEKCRDVGFTWLNCAFLVHRMLFRAGYKGTVGSYKAGLVDSLGNLDTILGKAWFLCEWIPETEGVNLPSLKRNLNKIQNLSNASIITGEAGDNMGRGGRSTMYFRDESAHVERPQKVDAAISANTDVEIEVSTPNGRGNPFAERRFSGNFPVFTFEWRDDPRKTEAWFNQKKLELDPVIFAQEILIDYSASTPGILISMDWLDAATEFEVEAIGKGVRVAGLDVADDGSNSNVFVVREGWRIVYIEDWSGLNTTQTAFKAMELVSRLGVQYLCFDAVGVGAGVGATFKESWDSYFPVDTSQPEWARYRPHWIPIKSGEKPQHEWIASERRWKEDKYTNIRAQLSWELRERFRKSYDRKFGIHPFPIEECISIPAHKKLKMQANTVLYEFTPKGLFQIMSKQKMQEKGIKSPDFFDALMLASYTPVVAAGLQREAVWTR